MVLERMPTPQNRYYLRSTDDNSGETEETDSSGQSTPDLNISAASSASLELSDIEDIEVIHFPEMASRAHITLPDFHGNPGESAEEWLVWFANYCTASNLDATHSKAAMPFFLKDHAYAWYQALPQDIKDSYDDLLTAMKARFNGSDGLDVDMALLTLNQQPGETCASYFTRILKVTAGKKYPESLLTSLALKGLQANLKTIVMPQAHTTLEALRKASILAERTVATTTNVSVNSVEDMTKIVMNVMKDQFSDIMSLTREHQPRKQTWNSQPTQRTEGQRGQSTNEIGEQEVACKYCRGRFFGSHICGARGITCTYCHKKITSMKLVK